MSGIALNALYRTYSYASQEYYEVGTNISFPSGVVEKSMKAGGEQVWEQGHMSLAFVLHAPHLSMLPQALT